MVLAVTLVSVIVICVQQIAKSVKQYAYSRVKRTEPSEQYDSEYDSRFSEDDMKHEKTFKIEPKVEKNIDTNFDTGEHVKVSAPPKVLTATSNIDTAKTTPMGNCAVPQNSINSSKRLKEDPSNSATTAHNQIRTTATRESVNPHSIRKKSTPKSAPTGDDNNLPDSVYPIESSGLTGTKKKFYQLYYPVGDDATGLLQAIYSSRYRGYLAGKILEMDKIPAYEEGGPRLVKIHVSLLPCKKYMLRTDWTTVLNGKATFYEYYKYTLNANNEENERELRVRAYGTRDSAGSVVKCVGECIVNIDEVEKEKGGMNFWISLSREKYRKGS